MTRVWNNLHKSRS